MPLILGGTSFEYTRTLNTRPTVAVTIGGSAVNVIEASVRRDLWSRPATASVLLADGAATVADPTTAGRSRLLISLGYSDANIQVFDGYTDTPSLAYWPYTNRVAGIGKLGLAALPSKKTFLFLSGLTVTDQEMVQRVLRQGGIAEADLFIGGASLSMVNSDDELGGKDIILPSGDAPLPFVQELDELLQYTTMDTYDGTIVRTARDVQMNLMTPAFSYVRGDIAVGQWPILNSPPPSRVLELRAMRNRVKVLGNTGAALTAGRINYCLREAHDAQLPADSDGNSTYLTLTLSSDLIQSATVAQTVAERNMRWHNRISERVRLTVPGNPYLTPNDLIYVTHSSLGITSQRAFLVLELEHSFAGGVFTTTLTLEGQVGGIGTQQIIVPTANILVMNSYAVGTDSQFVNLSGTLSTDPEESTGSGQYLTYHWSNSVTTQTLDLNGVEGGDDLYQITFTAEEWAAFPIIYLTVETRDGLIDAEQEPAR